MCLPATTAPSWAAPSRWPWSLRAGNGSARPCMRTPMDAPPPRRWSAARSSTRRGGHKSGGLTRVRLAGPDHLLLLRQLGPYDFESLAPGRCVSSVISKATVIVARSHHARLLLVLRRSFAAYPWRLIERSAQPYRPCIVAPAQCADPVFAPLLESA